MLCKFPVQIVLNLAKFEFIIMASIWIHIFDYWAMNMRSVRFSETPITIYQSTRCKITGNSNQCFCSCLPIYTAMQCELPNESSGHFVAVLSLFSQSLGWFHLLSFAVCCSHHKFTTDEHWPRLTGRLRNVTRLQHNTQHKHRTYQRAQTRHCERTTDTTAKSR